MAIKFLENVPLAPLTTFQVGGNARYFVEAETDEDIEAVFSENRGGDIFVLGGGSNVLISDKGFDGVVLRIATTGINMEDSNSGIVRVSAKAGEDWDDFVAYCVSKDLAGIECLSGIPGLVGGTPIQNVGAYGQEVSETIVSVRVLERATGIVSNIGRDECGFEYRKSIFNSTMKDRFVVLSVTYRLAEGGAPKLAYADLKKTFEGQKPGLAAVRAGVRRIRSEKGMLVRQGGPDSQSAGSFFKNPVIGVARLIRIAQVLGLKEDSVPRYEAGKGKIKVPAAWLIEQAGFSKGYKKGNAGISNRHSLALTNRGGATATEIVRLKEEIEERIAELFEITLINEPNLVGFAD